MQPASSRDQPLYAAVFLTKESRRQLINAIHIKHVNIFAEHCTLGFGRSMRPAYPIGTEIELRHLGISEDERGQVLVIEPTVVLTELLSENQCPHITISTAEGVKPFYSNELIKLVPPRMHLVDQDVLLRGVVDYYPRTID